MSKKNISTNEEEYMSALIRNKRVSILMCFYERPSFVPLILHNLKTQSFVKSFPDQVEFIIADDSSENVRMDINSVKNELKGIINDITYIRLETKLTIGAKRNLLCRTAKYGVVIFMDDDDYYFPSYIEYSLTELFKRRKALVGSNCMLFCYVNHDLKKLSISCISPRQIHEATMCMLKSHWQMTGGFNERGNGEGALLIDGHESKVNSKLDISKLMVCVCHSKNTCNKDMFINLGVPAEYPFSEELKRLVYECVHSSAYTSRARVCFKYASRSRPDQFMRVLDMYTSMLSMKHDYHFVISMDTNDTTMNNDRIKTYLDTKRQSFQMEYYYGESRNKVDAINRDMIAPWFDILLLISDDMIPQVKGFDDIIVQHFKTHFSDYDGMLNFNDGMRTDWPSLCTLTVYGYTYYKRFGYIYNPEYESVYCDNEQTDVGRLLERICDIDEVIIRHEWNSAEFQDDLRMKTEAPEYYRKDRETYMRRKESQFGIGTVNNNNCPLTVIFVTNRKDSIVDKVSELESLKVNVQVHYSTDPRLFDFSYLHRLTFTVTTPYLTFCFVNETHQPMYTSVLSEHLNSENDAVFFNQRCSLDNGKTFFTVCTDPSYCNDTIPFSGPWNASYRRCLTNWKTYKTSLCQSVPFGNDETVLINQLKDRIKKHVTLGRVLYEYSV